MRWRARKVERQPTMMTLENIKPHYQCLSPPVDPVSTAESSESKTKSIVDLTEYPTTSCNVWVAIHHSQLISHNFIYISSTFFNSLKVFVPLSYCSQMLSKDVDECVTALLKELVRFQDRLYQKDPMKARMKKRIVMGLREVLKHLKLRKVKCVVISPNCERIQSKGLQLVHLVVVFCIILLIVVQV